jgi:predicted RNA-binding Zn-ribbon protein involved in translation (DUF1610 family)
VPGEKSGFSTPNKKLAAVCGLFCPACTVFIGSTEEPARLAALSERFEASRTDMECHGCRSEKRGLYCNKACKMTKCASDRGVEFCGQCADYPCEDLKAFQSKMPHRLELWESHARIKEVGWETWYAEMEQQYACPNCGAMNSAYDLKCRKCETTPSCNYVKMHEKDVAKFRGKMGPA